MSAQVKLFSGDAQHDNTEPSTSALASTVPASQDDQAVLAELRAQYEKLRNEVGTIVAERSEQAAQLAQDGADELRSYIRSAPGTSIALAALAGGLVAVIATSRRADPTWQDSARNTAHLYQAALRNTDINELADRLRQTAESSLASTRDQAAGIMPGLERLAQTLSTMDSSTFAPAIEKGTSWLRSVWDKLPPASTTK